MYKWLIFLFWLCSGPAFAQTLRIAGWAEQGGLRVPSSSTLAMASYPAARITVYQAGTITKETIYADNMMTPKANPFTLTPGNGYWFFYPAVNTDHVDIVFDQGGIPAPFTLGDVVASGAGGGGGGGGGTVTQVTFPTIPSWLTAAVATNTTTPAISVTVASGQTSGKVIGTCGAGTTFTPCSLVAGDLPAGIVYNNQANTYTTGLQDFRSATALDIPVGAGLAPTASGSLGYDSTANAYKWGINGTSKVMASLTGGFTDGHCAQYQAASLSLIDSGIPCGGGGGIGFPPAGIPNSSGGAWLTSYTPTTLTAALNLFTSSLQGLTPASGGGTSNFLRADGNWAAPGGGGGGALTVQVGGTSTSTPSSTLNFISGTGINQACSYNSGAVRNDCTPAIDSAVVLRRDTDQAGTDATCLDASGSGTSYTCSTNPALGIYTRNQRIYFVPGTVSGVSPTLNVNGTGPLPLQWNINGTLTNVTTGQMVANLPYMLTAVGAPPTALQVQPTAYAPAPAVQSCGTTTTCSATQLTKPQIVTGSVALSSGTPSTAAITGISPAFTSSSTYHCTVSDATTATNELTVLAAGYVSGSAFTITGPSTITDVAHYICVGN